MRRKWGFFWGLLISLMAVPTVVTFGRPGPPKFEDRKGVERFREGWRVLEPISRSNLAVYPVVSSIRVDTSDFLTLDEGLTSGVVRVIERGQVENSLYRRRSVNPGYRNERPIRGEEGPSVNELVLVNDSTHPLILLAGEVVSGGKQNRIIGADLVVPPKSEPLPLTVFCVEHGRWSAGGIGFGAAKEIAHPTVRMEAQAKKSQAGVWDSVERSAGALRAASPTSNYLDVMNSPQAKRAFDEMASSIETDYEKELREQLRGRKAVGVVVAINGELVWSDVFPSQELFRKYWPKLLRSYVMEAEGRGREIKQVPTSKETEAFLMNDRGHVSIKVEPAAFRRTEISSEEYEIVALEALEKSTDLGLLVHYNKMSRD